MADPRSSEQDYLLKHDIDKLFESMMESLVFEQPSDPSAFLSQLLARQSVLSYSDMVNLLQSYKSATACVSPYRASLRIVDTVCELLHCDRASLFLYEACHNCLRMVVGKQANGIILAQNSGFTWEVFNSSHPVNIQSAYSHPRFDASVDVSTGYKTESLLGVPVKNTKNETIGVLLALNKKTGAFSHKDEAILEQLSLQAGNFIENAIFYQKAVNNERKAKALLSFVRQTVKDTPGQSLALELVNKAKDLLWADTCNIFMADYVKEKLVPIIVGANRNLHLPLNTGVLSLVVQNGEAISTDCSDSRFSKEFDHMFAQNTESLLVVPIKVENKVVGIIQATNKHSDNMFGDLKVFGRFDEDDIELLTTLSEILAKRLEKLFKSLSRGEESTVEHAVHFESGFGKMRKQSKDMPEGAIRETDEEEEGKS
jgi:GAF domain-containing protein